MFLVKFASYVEKKKEKKKRQTKSCSSSQDFTLEKTWSQNIPSTPKEGSQSGQVLLYLSTKKRWLKCKIMKISKKRKLQGNSLPILKLLTGWKKISNKQSFQLQLHFKTA